MESDLVSSVSKPHLGQGNGWEQVQVHRCFFHFSSIGGNHELTYLIFLILNSFPPDMFLAKADLQNHDRLPDCHFYDGVDLAPQTRVLAVPVATLALQVLLLDNLAWSLVLELIVLEIQAQIMRKFLITISPHRVVWSRNYRWRSCHHGPKHLFRILCNLLHAVRKSTHVETGTFGWIQLK